MPPPIPPTTLSYKPEVSDLKLILKKFEIERQHDREKMILERKREREMDRQQFNIELEKLMFDLTLPP